jgi:CO/xanthine dehydrogenase Mo-binding subunit
MLYAPSADVRQLIRLILDTLPLMREMSVAEQRYQAVLAVIAEGRCGWEPLTYARSVMAHARITVDASGAREHPGVVAVVTADDIADVTRHHRRFLLCRS